MSRHSICFEEKKADYVFFFLSTVLERRGEEVQENMEKRILIVSKLRTLLINLLVIFQKSAGAVASVLRVLFFKACAKIRTLS